MATYTIHRLDCNGDPPDGFEESVSRVVNQEVQEWVPPLAGGHRHVYPRCDREVVAGSRHDSVDVDMVIEGDDPHSISAEVFGWKAK